jgi:hypothetical protein
LFCQILAEAYLLTKNILINYNAKSVGQSEKRAGSTACGQKLFSDLIFWLLFHLRKK